MKIRLYVLKNIKKYTAIVKGSIVGLIVVNLMSVPISLISLKTRISLRRLLSWVMILRRRSI